MKPVIIIGIVVIGAFTFLFRNALFPGGHEPDNKSISDNITLVSDSLDSEKKQTQGENMNDKVNKTEEQWKHFISSLMEKPEDNTITSALDRYLLKKPKPPP